eukprot:6203303-Pleurochrysis_carterae.AAC.1
MSINGLYKETAHSASIRCSCSLNANTCTTKVSPACRAAQSLLVCVNDLAVTYQLGRGIEAWPHLRRHSSTAGDGQDIKVKRNEPLEDSVSSSLASSLIYDGSLQHSATM